MLTESQKTQGSPEWLELRKTKITASNLSQILGISPYGTKLDLYNEKINGTEIPDNPGMRAGREAEEQIRAWYESKSGELFMPTVQVRDWALSSLDGISTCGKKILECKLCNKETFAKADAGEVVPHYLTQIMWQLYCCPEAEEAHYVCYNSGEYAVVIVPRDEKYIAKLVKEGKKFYDEHLVPKIPPSATEKDYVTIKDPQAYLLADELNNLMKVNKESAIKEKALRARLFEFTDDGNCIIGPLKLTRSGGKTKVDYKKACEDNGVELKSYTTFGIGYFSIREIKQTKD